MEKNRSPSTTTLLAVSAHAARHSARIFSLIDLQKIPTGFSLQRMLFLGMFLLQCVVARIIEKVRTCAQSSQPNRPTWCESVSCQLFRGASKLFEGEAKS